MSKQLEKTYNPKETEAKLYEFWDSHGYFKAEVSKDKKPYTIMMPPPNITGQLHMGHALDNTLQDIIIRFRRMQGYEALWMPGTDHASIATEAKIVEDMAKSGLTKEQIGRDAFLERAWNWRKEYGGRITKQLRKLGSSCDWSRERFTLDDGCSKAVQKVFIDMYNEGLIYRGERIINWCPKCMTSISDAEVEHEDKPGHFWHLKYPLEDGSGYLELATTRPETMLGDTAVAVNPNDDRYRAFVGKNVMLPLVGRVIPIISDDYVDMEFGTGVVKITPAHDPNDFEVGLRHNLPVINVMEEDGRINENGGKYAGLDRYEARKAIVKELEAQGLLTKVEDITHSVGTCYRCSSVVEPRVSMQWFVKMAPLAAPAIDAVKNGDIKFVTKRFEKIYLNWMENIRDWCISRQLWWGHRIPAYYCENGHITVSSEKPEKCSQCGSHHIVQDEDTLDTWFSSALWPFSTLGWPDKTPELEYFYPTDTLVTAYDIIFFWVARMIFSGLKQMGEAPFKNVYIHGLVRDEKGRKMSKSLGNGVDPLEEIEKFGADALRMALVTGNSPGNDMRYTPEKVEASRNFTNKLWNAARFIIMNLSGDEKPCKPDAATLDMADKWILTKLSDVIKEVTDNIEKFEFGIALQKLYDFAWDNFCDWYIEAAKAGLNSERAGTVKSVLIYVMDKMLKLLHPFIPFVTEEIWQALPHDGESIMISEWPRPDDDLTFEEYERGFETIKDTIRAIRNRRAEMNVPPSKKAKAYVEAADTSLFEKGALYMQRLASCSEVETGTAFNIEGAVSIVTPAATIYIPMGELVDFEAERARLNKERETAQKSLSQCEAKLANEGFVSKAPAEVVEKQKRIAAELRDKIAMIDSQLKNLQ